MNGTSILQPDDFKEGMFMTVVDLKEKQEPPKPEMGENPIQAMMMMVPGGHAPPASRNHLEMLKGTVIRIDAINLPFIMVTIFETSPMPGKVPNTHSAPLDVREVSFIKLNQSYVDAYMGKGPLAHLLQGQDFNSLQNLDIDIKGYNTLKELLDAVVTKIENGEKRKDNENT